MSLLLIKLDDNRTVGVVRNHKCGTTTVMNYIGQAFYNADPSELQNYKTYTEGLGKHRYLGKHQDVSSYYAQLLDCDIRIALWRDPVDKFVSGYNHIFKHGHVRQCLGAFLDNFIENWQLNTVKDHCSSNTDRLGPDPGVFTHVVNYKDIDQKIIPLLEKLSNKQIVPVKFRVQETKTTVSKKHVEIIKQLQYQDYINGWC
jgi:hypothetical protein